MSVDNTAAEGAFAFLAKEQFILLKTFRKSGVEVPTPVWFAEEQGKLYILTQAHAGKVKRIRNNPRVLLAPCNSRGVVHGQEVEGAGRILSASEQAEANAFLSRKYGFTYKVFALLQKLRRTERGFLEISPV